MKSKRRSVGLLLVMASIMILVATWDLPEEWPKDNQRSQRDSNIP